MTRHANRGPDGKFAAKPVLHRQMPDPCRPQQRVEVLPGWCVKYAGQAVQNFGETPLYVQVPQHSTYWLEPIFEPAPTARLPHAIIAATVAAVCVALAVCAWLMGGW